MKILYICTHNRCRSILCEAITNASSHSSLEARSLSLKYLAEQGYSTDGLKSESWDDFEDYQPDIVITVCDSAAGEACPVYFGNSLKLHWGLEDPSKIEGSEEDKAQAFYNTIDIIEKRVAALTDIVSRKLAIEDIKKALQEKGAQ